MATYYSAVLLTCRRSYVRNASYFLRARLIHATSLDLSVKSSNIVDIKPISGTIDDDFSNDELMSLKDKSQMPKLYRDRMRHVMNPPEQPDYITDMTRSLELKRRIFAKYGRRSGLDPGILWPSATELSDQIAFEKEWEPTSDKMMSKVQEQQRAEAKAKQEKRQLVERQMAKMPQLIDEYRVKLKKADEQEHQREAKRRALLDEARDYFGFNIDPRDPRFERMQEMKEEEEKKMKKQKKKDAKTTRWLDLMKKDQQQIKD